jgi:hypothetical protein
MDANRHARRDAGTVAESEQRQGRVIVHGPAACNCGVITFFRAIFPAKTSSGQKQPESFPLS